MKSIVNGLAIDYDTIGTGPVVVILHGWGTNRANMVQLASYLSANFMIINVDLPGFGGSQVPNETWGVGEYGEFLVHFLDKLKITDIHALVGHSFGGRIVIKTTGTKKLNPQKIVLIGSAGIKHSSSVRNRTYAAIARVGKIVFSLPLLSIFRDTARTGLYASAGSSDYVVAGPMRDVFTQVINEDLKVFAKEINQPALLIWGENDDASPPADAEVFRSLIKNSSLVLIPGAGHFVHTDNPQKVNELIGDFLHG